VEGDPPRFTRVGGPEEEFGAADPVPILLGEDRHRVGRVSVRLFRPVGDPPEVTIVFVVEGREVAAAFLSPGEATSLAWALWRASSP